MAPDFDLIAMPMFFQILTATAPSSKDWRRRPIVRSANPGPSNPRASKVEAQSSVPPLSRRTLSVARSLASRSNGSSPLAGQTTMSSPCQFMALIASRSAGASRWMWMCVSIRPKSGASAARAVASSPMAGIERRISLRVGIWPVSVFLPRFVYRLSRRDDQLRVGVESPSGSSWYSLSTAPSFLSSSLSVMAWIRARVI